MRGARVPGAMVLGAMARVRRCEGRRCEGRRCGVRRRRRGETADRLPPEPAAGGDGRCLTARLELFFQIAEDEVAPAVRQAPRQQQDGDAR